MIRPGLGDRVTVVHPATGGITDARIIEERRTWDRKGQTVKFGLDNLIHNPLERLAQKPARLRDVKTVPSTPANVTARGRYQYNIVSWRSTASEWAIAYRRSDESAWHYTSTREAEWIHAGLQVGEEWLYRVAAIRDGVMSPWSSTVSAVVAAVPEADFDNTPPGNVTWDTCYFITDITLRWFPAARAAGYEIRTEDANWGEAAGRVWMGNATDLHLTPTARSHTYYIRAISAAGVYSSASASVTVQNSVPSTPAPPSVTEFFSALWMQLQAVADDDVLGYVLYATPVDENGIATGDPQVTPYPGAWPQRITYPAVSGTRYRLEVAAYDVIGEGGKSTPVYATAQHLDDLTVPDWVTEPIENIAERYVVETDANGNLIGLVKVNDPEGVHSQIAVLVDRFSIATPDGRRQIFVFDTDDRKLYLMGDLVAEGLLRATEIQAELAKHLLLQAQLATIDEADVLRLRADKITVGGSAPGIPLTKPEGAKLWHFDGSLTGTQGETPEDGAVATLRPGEGRFGGAVAVEEGTTNLYSDGDYSSGNLPPVISATRDWAISTHTAEGTKPPQLGMSDRVLKHVATDGSSNWAGRDIPISANTVYTASVWVWVSPNFAGSAARLAIEQATASFVSASADLSKKGQWQRLIVTFTSSSTATNARVLAYVYGATAGYVLYDGMQLEQKPYATSFVDGSRPNANLSYRINPNFGTIGCWLYVPRHTASTDYSQAFLVTGTSGNNIMCSVFPTGKIRFWSTGNNLMSSNSIDRSAWNHVVIAWDENKKYIYVNGVKTEANVSKYTLENDRLYIGHPNYCLNGLIDELLILPYAATPEQIQAWYAMGAPFVDPNSAINADASPISAARGQVYIGEPGIAVANGAMIFVSGTFSHDQLGRLITAAVDRPITTDPGGQKSISAPVEISAARGHEVYKGKLNVWAGTGGAGDTRYIHDGRVTDDGIIGMDALKLAGTVAMENLPGHLIRTAPGVSGAVMYYARTPIVELGPKATMQLTFTTAMPYVPELLVMDRRGYLSGTLEFDNVSKTGFRITNTDEDDWIRSYDNVSFFWIALCASHDPSTSSCDNCQEECQGDCQQSGCQTSCEGAAGCQQGCEFGGQMPCDDTCQDACMFSCQLPPPMILWT